MNLRGLREAIPKLNTLLYTTTCTAKQLNRKQITNMDLLQDLDAYVSVYHEMYIKARNESEGLPMYFKHKEKEICNEVKEEHNWLNSNYIEALVEYRLWVHMCESHCLEIHGSC